METILIPGAEIYYEKNFLASEEATSLFNILRTKCAWQRHKSSFKYAVPRDEARYGDPGTNYTYSRREYKPLAWIPELLSLRARVEETTPAVAYSNLSLPRQATTPLSVTFTKTELTASACMRMRSLKWGR